MNDDEENEEPGENMVQVSNGCKAPHEPLNGFQQDIGPSRNSRIVTGPMRMRPEMTLKNTMIQRIR